MEKGIAILAFSFVVAFIVVRILKPLAYWAELVDKPGGRKTHQGVIPLIGGIAIYASVFLTSLIFLEQPIFIRLFLLAGGLIVFMGMVDDRYELSARFRLAGQFIICCIFVYGLDINIHTFGNILGIGELNPGWLGYPLAVLSLMGAINAFNMLDGMDGLVGSISMVSLAGLVALFGVSGDYTFQLLCMAFVGATGAFLIFNIWGKPQRKQIKKVFMGDAGSMFLGLAIGVVLIHGSQKAEPAFTPITALWLVLLPMTDMFTIMYRRIRRGRSPMAPDRTHIHHILLRAGLSQSRTLFVMVFAQIVFVCVGGGTIKVGMSESSSFLFSLFIVVTYQLLMKRSWKFIKWSRRRMMQLK
jgi:UDP-GlcNAc:undecaprenyl-phosphate GlcNAc-1-phosphate transferase